MKGFTLIELLIVIAILAVLTTTVVLVLNPAQLLAEARDAQRMGDLDSTRSAISLFLATATNTSSFVTATRSTFNATCVFTTPVCTVPAAADLRKVDGNGWVVVNFGATSGGSPLATLPVDPSNNTTSSQYMYRSDAGNKTFEINAQLESTKYNSLMANDGGTLTNFYEIGSDPGLDL